MKLCAYCGKENESEAPVCAKCGADFSVNPQNAGRSETEIRWKEVLMNPSQLFRTLIVLSTVTYIVWFVQLLVAGSWISEGTWDALSWQGYGALLPPLPRLGWLFFLLFIAVAIGLWNFSKSARVVFAMLVCFTIFMSLLGGVQVQTATGSFLLLLTNMADGAILLMAYTAPLKNKFE